MIVKTITEGEFINEFKNYKNNKFSMIAIKRLFALFNNTEELIKLDVDDLCKSYKELDFDGIIEEFNIIFDEVEEYEDFPGILEYALDQVDRECYQLENSKFLVSAYQLED